MEYRVYEYGITAILSNEHLLIEQLRLRNHYRNKLVEIEHHYQEQKEALLHDGSAAVEAAQTALDGALEHLEYVTTLRNQSRVLNRTKRLPQSEHYQQARTAVREARAILREAKHQAYGLETVQQALKDLERQRQDQVNAARGESGLFWGTYLDVENHHQTSRKKAGTHLKFRRYDGQGAVSVWILNGGMPVGKLYGGSNSIQIDQLPESTWVGSRSYRRHNTQTRVRLRIGTADRQPVFAEAEVIMHRPLPETGNVRHASIVRRVVGSRCRYFLTVTIGNPLPDARATGPICGVDVGWRLLPDGSLRSAYLTDDQGIQEELRLPERLVNGLRKAADIDRIRDQRFNDIRNYLLDTMNGNSPPWLVEACQTLPRWRSKTRMQRLVEFWRDNRFDGDGQMYFKMEHWRSRDKHLLEYDANLSDKLLRRRRDIYRNFAQRVSQRYSRIFLEDFDLREVLGKDRLPREATNAAEQPGIDKQAEAARWLRRVASISELRTIMENTSKREGSLVLHVQAEYTTQDCHICEHRNDFDALANLSHTCDNCGQTWDQDYNGARNLLKAGVLAMQVQS